MKIDFDMMADAVYVNVTEGKVAKTVKTEDRFLVDLDKDGNVVGIEILQASAQQELIDNLNGRVANGVPVNIQNNTPVVA
ncbi:DUF2283 domain-containing protein [bacterium]|nr:DUF2283 domain-containing protein [bacterium]